MTDKLYYADSHLYEFSAVVLDIVDKEKCKAVVLDRTAFFPEGGGQPSDTGYIDNVFISDVQEKDGIIYHYTNDPLIFSIGDKVIGRLDGEVRFARMQSHSGEHIVSGIAHNLFGAENVGFHMIDLVMTVDFDKPFNKEQIRLIEKEANNIVYKNVSVKTEIVSGEKLKSLQYRSKLDLTENVRLVTVEGVDVCACCAPHVTQTGEIGLIKILSCVSHRGGVRLSLICGRKAYEDYCAKHEDIMEISDMLKAPNNETPAAVEELLTKVTNAKYELEQNRQKLYHYIYSDLNDNKENIVLFIPGLSSEELRELSDLCKSKTEKLFAVFSGNDTEGYAYAIASERIRLRTWAQKINNDLRARGGGRDEMLQGRASSSEKEIRAFFNEIEV